MLIDTHCHLTDRYTDGADAIIARAVDAGVDALICACAEPEDFASAIALTEKYKNIFCTIGIHPERINEKPDYEKLLSHPRVVGVGEIGLDYHYNNENKNQQIELFMAQIEIARRVKLPIAVHTREAEEDTAKILDGSVGGVMHCFTSSWDLAKKMLDRGFYFSASGIITFKNSEELRNIFSKIPNDKIVIETDSPFCAPVPYRGKQCEPAMITETAKVLATIKGIELSDLETILINNTKKLYPKLCEAL
jgi:TatD DNase family protein